MNRTFLVFVIPLFAFLYPNVEAEAQPLGRGDGSASMATHQHQAEQMAGKETLKAHKKERKKLKAWAQWEGDPESTPEMGTLAYVLKAGIGNLETVAKYGNPSTAWNWDIRSGDGVVVINFANYFTEASYSQGYYALIEGERGYHLFRLKNYSAP